MSLRSVDVDIVLLKPADPVGAVTVVTLTSTIEIGGNPLARLAELVVGRAMAKRSNTMLAGLAQRLEDKHG
ncbi:Uncharacterised protein [Mycobacterium tuberculosis]|nr:Uncharacterised protein [Mycobacterium tuberculosis]